MIRATFVIALLLFGLSPARGRADWSETTCHSATKSELAAHDFPRPGRGYPEGWAIEICSAYGRERYFWFSPPARSRVGVCEISKQEIVSTARSDGTKSWDFADAAAGRRPTLMALEPSARCPEGGSPRYIPAEGVSPGVFLTLTGFWNDVMASRGKSIERQVSTAECAPCAELIDAIARRSTVDATGLEDRVELRGVGISPAQLGKTTVYQLTVENSRKTWQLNGDFEKGVFVVASVHLLL